VFRVPPPSKFSKILPGKIIYFPSLHASSFTEWRQRVPFIGPFYEYVVQLEQYDGHIPNAVLIEDDADE